MRESGILFPVFSLPSEFGIGSLSKEAYEFIDFLKKAGQGYWQILPTGPTGYGDSPYQPVSAFAGNPYFISPEKLIEEDLLTWDEVNGLFFGDNRERVDYGALYFNRKPMLRMAYNRFCERGLTNSEDFKSYREKQSYWLDDYCMYMVLKDKYEGKSWLEWDPEYRLHDRGALELFYDEAKEDIDFWAFVQFVFDKQWTALHRYASEKNVKIIGDIPFYVSLDGADAWAHSEVFRMDECHMPIDVAGCPPDAFSTTGQLWGNPIYDWESEKRDGYDWWMKRMARSFELYDVVRIDHFHGFADYYAIPYGDETAENGTRKKGPGMDFFKRLKECFGDILMPEVSEDDEENEKPLKIIAEDLGTVTKENKKLLSDSEIPGMKILQYAFTSWNSVYMTHRHEKNCVVYTGTHDNTTARAWVEEISEGDRNFTRRYLNSMNSDYGALVWDFIREAYRSVADLCIIPLQDYLVLGKEARINSPGTAEGNWQWRLKPNFLSTELANSIRDMVATYGRMPQDEKL